jgi:hypothetical protein
MTTIPDPTPAVNPPDPNRPPLVRENYELMCINCGRCLGNHNGYACLNGHSNFALTTTPTTPLSPNPTQVSTAITTPSGSSIHFRVHVTLNPVTYQPQFNSSHALPSMNRLLEFLPDIISSARAREARNNIERYAYGPYTPDQVGNGAVFTLTAQEWQDALVAELRARLADKNDEPVPHDETFLATPAYLVIGGEMYKLTAQAKTKTSTALKALRSRITNEATRKAEAIISEANTNAAAIITSANKQFAKAKRTLEDAERAGKLSPPAWTIEYNIPVYYKQVEKRWCVADILTIAFTHLYYKWEELIRDPKTREIIGCEWRWKRWSLTPAPAIKARYWTMLAPDGTYNVGNMYIDRLSPQLPHMSHGSGCLAPADAPKTITSRDDLQHLRTSIQRTFQVIDYSSPLVRAQSWPPEVRAFIPQDLLDILISENITTLSKHKSPEHGILDLKKEDSETWKVA